MMEQRSVISRGRGAAGRVGEDAACDYLLARGHRIAARNWRAGHREVDIVTLDGEGNLRFVEVKTRLEPIAAGPFEQVDARKRRNIEGAARSWLTSRDTVKPPSGEVFFDIVSVVLGGGRSEVEYFPGAWIPMY